MLQTQGMTPTPSHSIQTHGRPVVVLSIDVELLTGIHTYPFPSLNRSIIYSPDLPQTNRTLYHNDIIVTYNERPCRQLIVPLKSQNQYAIIPIAASTGLLGSTTHSRIVLRSSRRHIRIGPELAITCKIRHDYPSRLPRFHPHLLSVFILDR